MRIVIDTHVIASAFFFGGKPYQLLHFIMEGRVVVEASKEIVDEYEEIVLRHCRPLSLSKVSLNGI